ncbi:hypothetical protein ACTMU2_36065 (plasmid) [Cupriavidus basilensis]|uniref:hypothetical protein n=1 Tax=unclassified Cupriavidus TaxID=2640874 RepID=UPI0010F8F825|nr:MULTISPECIES: hypothetical protein [unclassified Cupriavidus]MWL92189.1 hypothetical protein [Cupriavidus sp. SW-Y-13]
MHTIFKSILLVSLGVFSGFALAGPNWDVINSARAAAQQRDTTAAIQAARLAQCDQMMKKMGSHPMSSGKDAQPMTPMGPSEAK